MTTQSIRWLLEGPKWLSFAVRKQLLDEQTDSKDSLKSKEIIDLVKVIRSKDRGFEALIKGKVSYTKELYWYLFFLADIGFKAGELNLDTSFQKVLDLEDSHHKFLVSKEMKPDFFCISSILLTAMVKMSEHVKDRLRTHLVTIMDAQRLDGGWHCAKSRAIGQKLEKSGSCLMDNLNILMLLAEYEEYINNPKLEGAIDLLLAHWRRRDEKWRPYGFGIGSDFKKLRYPAFKYGIVRVLDVLSIYPYAVKQAEFDDMLDCVLQKADNGRYRPESVSKMFNKFDFGQKKEPSRWLTFLLNRIEKRHPQR
ncbi:MAG: hypothetical protein GY710_21845 [Desulfobacteraceae bacterium]|nr:hypothetical protein [Desulfobacteraceae bacterium]